MYMCMYMYLYMYISFFNPITTAQHVFHAQPCCESRLGATTDFAVMATPTNTASLVRPDPSLPASSKAPPQWQSLLLRGKLMHPNTTGGGGKGANELKSTRGRNQRHARTTCLQGLVQPHNHSSACFPCAAVL